VPARLEVEIELGGRSSIVALYGEMVGRRLMLQPVRGDQDDEWVQDGMSDARLILTCGLPGTGKTTLAIQIAADRGAVRLTKDEWLWALGSSPWDEAANERIEQQLWRLAQEMLSHGLSVVLDFGLWGRAERDEMRVVARGLGVGVELHYLDVPTDELWRRIEVRNSAPPWQDQPISRADLDEWQRVIEVPEAEELALFDTPPR
jgi:predicted kinase